MRFTVFAFFTIFLSQIISIGAEQPGSLDQSFGETGFVFVHGTRPADQLRVNHDGSITTVAGYAYGKDTHVSRHDSVGTPANFGSSGVFYQSTYADAFPFLSDAILLPDGKTIAVGWNWNGQTALVRLNSNGTLDGAFGDNGIILDPFGPGADVWNDSLLLVGEDRLMVAAGTYLAKIDFAGRLDPTFGNGGRVSGQFNRIKGYPGGKFVFLGQNFLSRSMPDGSPDATFGDNGRVGLESWLTDFEVHADGKIVIVDVPSQTRSRVRRFNPDGSLDTSFASGAFEFNETRSAYDSGRSNAVEIQSNGKIVVGGSRDSVFSVTRLNVDGTIDKTFGLQGEAYFPAIMGSRIFDLDVQPDGKIVAMGEIGSYTSIARLRGDPVSPADLVSVSGRVSSPNGLSLRNVSVRLIDEGVVIRSATTGSFGNFSFDSLPTGRDMTISVTSKRYRFAPRTITTTSTLTGIEMVAVE